MSKMIKDIHMTGKEITEMVQLRPQDIGKYCVIPSPKERLDGFLRQIEKPLKNFSFMEYEMQTGTYEGIRVTAMNGGRYSADTAITTELLCGVDASMMIRLGSCGALNEEMKIGDIVIADSAIRGEGVTPYYVDDANFQPEADKELADALVEAAEKTGIKVHRGRVWTTDALLRLTRENVEKAISQECIATDLVASTFLTLAQLNNIPAVVMMAVSDNVIDGKLGFMDTQYYMTEHMMSGICLDLIKNLEEQNKVAS